ncbi:hypothetical protein COV81_03885 [Candidatus Peregrinibacteria bacterium CG11_big_fil_rev_8_21_14_0_20_41_10]|nr:MAG: hypothetical protein COV81_03885 [Candidatus Peregrinibacteria bacterium CG11_big_fil_rev_8_21_14_0_20_41_10]PJC38230.1 MAG: hypothetical protein CO045_01275 [Candidatus Peregrinibacteria bacterium CG_4_9_14_0_2_um_filter_41_14]
MKLNSSYHKILKKIAYVMVLLMLVGSAHSFQPVLKKLATGIYQVGAQYGTPTGPPPELYNLAVGGSTDTTVTLTWDSYYQAGVYFEVFYSTSAEVTYNNGTLWGYNQDTALGQQGNESYVGTTTVTGLTAGTTYYFVIYLLDSNSSTYSLPSNEVSTATTGGASNTIPAATTPSITGQATDGSGYITFTTAVSDADSDTTKLKVEYSDNGGSSWYDPDLVSVTPSAGTTDLDDAQTYQIGTVNAIDTDTGSKTMTIVWDTQSANNGNGALTGDQSDIQVRVTPNDGTDDGTVQASSSFQVDNAAPSQVTGLAITSTTAHAAALSWTAAVDSDWAGYKIYYDTTTGITSSTYADGTKDWLAVDDANLSTKATAATTVNDTLTAATTYYFVIYSVDDVGNLSTISAEATDDTLTPGITVTEVGGASTDVTEGSTTDTFTVVLDTQPANSVTVALTAAGSEVSFSANSLTFTTGDWDSAQTVTVTAVNDDIDEDAETDTISYTVTSDDADYSGFDLSGSNITANITDNDTAGVTVAESASSTNVTEVTPATTDTYTVVLTSQPTANTTISLSYDTVQLNIAEASDTPDDDTLLFTAANWNTPQTITVNALDDSIDDPATATITHALSASNTDPKYDSDSAIFSINSVTVNITDNDTAGITVTEVGGASTDVTEGSTTDTFTVVLDTQPTASVTVALAAAGSEVSFSANSLTFTTGNWNSAQTVTVTAVNDDIDENAETDTISYTVTSVDANYSGFDLSGSNITANITDNDTAGVTVTESAGSTAATEGSTDTYDVVLTTQPTANVNIVITTTADFSTDKVDDTLTFTSGDWSTPQTVTLTATDDSIDETSPEAVTVSHTASSTDGKYSGINIADVSFAITDNDTAGITVAEVGGASTDVTEGSTTDTFTVVLDTQPTASVTVALAAAGSEVSFSANSLTFTTGNWNSAQTVTVTAVNDDIDEDAETDTISYTVTSADANYSGFDLSGSNITANITDNDTASITVTESAGSTAVTEGAVEGDTFTVVLGTQPTADVTVNVSAAAGLTIDDSSLLFTSANWNSTQTITVTGTDNDIDGDDTSSADISFSISTVESKYNALAHPSNVTVTITDDDTAGVTVTEAGGSTTATEGGTDTYAVVLSSEPTDDVTLTIEGDANFDARATLDPTTLTFTGVNWDTAQTVTITATDNAAVDGSATGTISHAAASDDAKYNAILVSDVTATIEDNDVASSSGGGGGGGSFSFLNLNNNTNNVTLINSSGVQLEIPRETIVTDDVTGDVYTGTISPPEIISPADAPTGTPFGKNIRLVIRLQTSEGNDVHFDTPIEVCVPKPANLATNVEIWFYNVQQNKWEFSTADVNINRSNGKLCFKTDHFSYFAIVEPILDFDQNTEFTDIKGHWAEEHIKYLESLGIIAAGPQKTFTPDRSINRGELVSMTVAAFGIKLKGDANNIFTDLLSTSSHYKSIMAAYEKGIIKGYPDGTFQEYGPALRVEALKILLVAGNKSKGCPAVNEFTDISTVAWYYEYINCGVFYGIVQGYGNGKFLPARQVTKAEAAKMLAEILSR